jgi:hypothetical protein
VLEDPLVKRVLEIFPGARVANITDHGDEQAAPAPDEPGPDEPNDEQP